MSRKSPSPSPNSGWFPKGRSGNPRGRPTASGASTASVFDVVVKRTLTVARNGNACEIPLEEAIHQRIFQDALAGKRIAQREILKWIMKRDTWRAKHTNKASGREIPILSSPDPDNADKALLLLGIATPIPERADIGAKRAQLLLEPWAVQAALRRRRGGNRLTETEVNEIKRCTRDPDCLRWPRGTDE